MMLYIILISRLEKNNKKKTKLNIEKNAWNKKRYFNFKNSDMLKSPQEPM